MEYENYVVNKGKGKYCSIACKHAHASVSVVCHQCGKTFIRPKSLSSEHAKRKTKHDYCSPECYDAYRIQLVEFICQVCGKTFSVWKSRADRGKVATCSPACRGKYVGEKNKKPVTMRTCELCGTEFPLKSSYKQQRFCSPDCYGAWRAQAGIAKGANNPGYIDGSTIETMQRVRTRDWKKIASQVRTERGNFCELCGDGGSGSLLPVHHKVPWRISHDDNPENLQILCSSCHALEDGKLRAS